MSEETAQPTASPPYIAFASLKTFVGGLKEHGVPSRIDRSIMTNFSGAVAGQVITALKFLQLVNGENRPTSYLAELVAAHGEAAWKDVVGKVVKHAYSPLFQMDLQAATPSLFTEEFKRHYGGADAVMRKCMTFFLNAVREAEIPVGPRLLSGTKPRSAPAKRKAVKAEPKPLGQAKKNREEFHPPPLVARKPSEMLFDEFDPSTMPPDIQEAVWALIKYFKAKEK